MADKNSTEDPRDTLFENSAHIQICHSPFSISLPRWHLRDHGVKIHRKSFNDFICFQHRDRAFPGHPLRPPACRVSKLRVDFCHQHLALRSEWWVLEGVGELTSSQRAPKPKVSSSAPILILTSSTCYTWMERGQRTVK